MPKRLISHKKLHTDHKQIYGHEQMQISPYYGHMGGIKVQIYLSSRSLHFFLNVWWDGEGNRRRIQYERW